MVASTVIVTAGSPLAKLGIVQGNAVHPPPVTLIMVRLSGVSVTTMFVAVLGPVLLIESVYSTVSPTA